MRPIETIGVIWPYCRNSEGYRKQNNSQTNTKSECILLLPDASLFQIGIRFAKEGNGNCAAIRVIGLTQ